MACFYLLSHSNFLFLHKFLLERKITYYTKLFAVLVAALLSVFYLKYIINARGWISDFNTGAVPAAWSSEWGWGAAETWRSHHLQLWRAHHDWAEEGDHHLNINDPVMMIMMMMIRSRPPGCLVTRAVARWWGAPGPASAPGRDSPSLWPTCAASASTAGQKQRISDLEHEFQPILASTATGAEGVVASCVSVYVTLKAARFIHASLCE